MKPRLQTSLGQQLVMTPQLRQAIKLLQMSSVELDAEITEAVETNPLLEWTDQNDDGGAPATGPERETPAKAEDAPGGDSDEPRTLDEPQWSTGAASSEDDNPAERVVEPESLADHLLWQLHLEPLSARDRMIGAALIDALDADGYLREPLAAIADTLQPELTASEDEILAVLCRIQQLEPTGIGARSLGECLSLQLDALEADADGRTLALEIVRGPLLERLPRAGIAGLAAELRKPQADVEVAVHLLRSLDPAPGRGIGDMEADTYVVPDCVVWRSHGVWQVALSGHSRPRIAIHRGYERTGCRLSAQSPAGSTLAAERPGGPRRNARQGDALPDARAGRVPRIRPAGLAPAHPARSRRHGRPARIDDFPHHRAQVRAHPARHLADARVLRLRHRH